MTISYLPNLWQKERSRPFGLLHRNVVLSTGNKRNHDCVRTKYFKYLSTLSMIYKCSMLRMLSSQIGSGKIGTINKKCL